ncbi:hypothetical protein V1478_011786 [Vespula squamosa]|uniref:Uncharacterized protein n=1 Tax=Vespula squamosa TaxID=30214 RepID=A0ABD2ADK5_VESSQ
MKRGKKKRKKPFEGTNAREKERGWTRGGDGAGDGDGGGGTGGGAALRFLCLWLEGRAAFPPGKRRGWLWVSWRLPMEVAGGWQSVEASGADQWPDGASPGILTL